MCPQVAHILSKHHGSMKWLSLGIAWHTRELWKELPGLSGGTGPCHTSSRTLCNAPRGGGLGVSENLGGRRLGVSRGRRGDAVGTLV